MGMLSSRETIQWAENAELDWEERWPDDPMPTEWPIRCHTSRKMIFSPIFGFLKIIFTSTSEPKASANCFPVVSSTD